jgi:ABC-type lipoprotein release transport system permease subunit
VYRFFSLLAFVALILGCIGVASSVHIYAREKRDEVAVLRCIGSSGWQAFNIYFIQIFVLGIIGSAIGAVLGVLIQQIVPIVFGKYLPVELQFGVSWRAVSRRCVVRNYCVCFVFNFAVGGSAVCTTVIGIAGRLSAIACVFKNPVDCYYLNLLVSGTGSSLSN